MLGGAHHVSEVRVDIHQRERIGYGAPDLALGFAHRPQPCGVDMRVTHCGQGHGRGIGGVVHHLVERLSSQGERVVVFLVPQVDGSLHGLGELPIARVSVVHVFERSGDDVKVGPVVEHVLIQSGDIDGTELIAFVCFAGGLGAQLGNGKRRDIRVVSAFDINHERAVRIDHTILDTVSGDKRHPVIARVQCLDDGAIGTVCHGLNVTADGPFEPTKVEHQLDGSPLGQGFRATVPRHASRSCPMRFPRVRLQRAAEN